MPNLQTYNHFKLVFQKVDQNTGGTKWCKDNQLQSLELPFRVSSRECKHDIKESGVGHLQNQIPISISW